MKFLKLAACITSASLLIACGGSGSSSNSSDKTSTADIEKAQLVLNTNADIAYAAYTDSVNTAKELQAALLAFKIEASKATGDRDDAAAENLLVAAKKAWLVSREPYGQTEVYRFRNSPIDSTNYADENGPEGDINAWPLGEALIDYVQINSSDFDTDKVGVENNSAGINANADGIAGDDSIDEDPNAVDDNGGPIDGSNVSQNIIATTTIDITPALFAEAASDDRAVLAGYHAIEFLLWGQDLNDSGLPTIGTDREDAVKTEAVKTATAPVNPFAQGGQRPLADFTTNANADRRHLYLEVVVAKLITDLTQVQQGWAKGDATNYRAQFTTIKNEADANNKLAEILTGMGTLSEGELSGERIQQAFFKNSQEDEHSCFSDNTHRDIWLNAEGVSNSFTGTYAGYDSNLDGIDDVTTNAITNGYGINDYLAYKGLNNISAQIATALNTTKNSYSAIDESARMGKPFDVLIQTKDSDGIVATTITSLSGQARLIQEAATQLGLGEVVDPEASTCNTQDPTSACE